MNLYDFIWKRKSTRKYDMTPLGEEQMERIEQFAKDMKPLYPGIETAYEITSDVKGLKPLKAPRYLIIYSEAKDGYLENAGFMFQQMDLFLSSEGLGSCWFGAAKTPAESKPGMKYVITLAFGKAEGSPYRELSEFKRKPLSEISSGSDERIEAARLAPSAVNFQNWFFAAYHTHSGENAAHGKIDVYRKKTILSAERHLGDMSKIDMGIALCHLYLATEHAGREFILTKEADKSKSGYVYVGTVS